MGYVEDCQDHQKLCGERGIDPPPQSQTGMKPGKLTLDFQPPEPRKYISSVFNDPVCGNLLRQTKEMHPSTYPKHFH